MRIGIAGFMHESNSFLNVPTTIERYRETGIQYGDQVDEVWRDAHHEVGGSSRGPSNSASLPCH